MTVSCRLTGRPVLLWSTGIRGEKGGSDSNPRSWRVQDSQSRPNSSLLHTHGYCLSAQHTHSTALFTASQQAGLGSGRSVRRKRDWKKMADGELITRINCSTSSVEISFRMSA